MEYNEIYFEPLYELIKGTNEQKNQVWDYCYSEIYKNIKIYARFKNFTEIEDLISYAYIIFIKKCNEYDPYYNNNFYPFMNYILKQIKTNILAYIQRYYFKNKREQVTKLDDDIIKYLENSNIMGNKNENYLDIKNALNELDPKLRKIIMMRLQGYKQQEIADKLGLTQSRICIILKSLKLRLNDNNIKITKNIKQEKSLQNSLQDYIKNKKGD